ncbi:hypothetical protein Dimus_025143 [Dionaea muscipula]
MLYKCKCQLRTIVVATLIIKETEAIVVEAEEAGSYRGRGMYQQQEEGAFPGAYENVNVSGSREEQLIQEDIDQIRHPFNALTVVSIGHFASNVSPTMSNRSNLLINLLEDREEEENTTIAFDS